MNRLLSLLILVAFAGPLRGAVTDELLDQLRSELRVEIKAAREKGTEDRSLYALQELYARVGRLPLRDGSGHNLDELLQSFEAFTGPEKIQQLTMALAAQVRKDSAVRENEFAEESGKLSQASVKQALAGKTAKDLDGAIAALSKFLLDVEQRPANSATMRNAIKQVAEAGQFVRQWQDYLAALDAGNELRARELLRSMATSLRDFSLIPRSELLARANGHAPAGRSAGTIRGRIKTLEDLDRAIGELANAEGSGTNAYSLNAASQLRALAKSYADIKAGLATNVVTNMSNSMGDEFGDLRRLLILFALPRTLGLPESEKAGSADNALQYLRQALAAARLNGDWPLAWRILQLSRSLQVDDALATTDDVTMLRAWISGLNQEAANQWALAVSSFHNALRTGSQIVPGELIGKHLTAIQNANPQEFERGVQLFLSPPTSDRSPRPLLPPPPVTPRAEPTISVPAATPPAAPAGK